MRRLLERRCPEAETVAGTAEEIPLADASVDAVFAAEAFHRFDKGRALAEIVRVLRPGGALVLLWNLPAGPTEPPIAALEQFLAERGPKPGEVDYDPLDLRGAGFSFGDDRSRAPGRASSRCRSHGWRIRRQSTATDCCRSSPRWAGSPTFPTRTGCRCSSASGRSSPRTSTDGVGRPRSTGRDSPTGPPSPDGFSSRNGTARCSTGSRRHTTRNVPATRASSSLLRSSSPASDPESRVVEVGSGTGKLTEELVALGLHIEAVEPGRNMIEVARRRLQRIGARPLPHRPVRGSAAAGRIGSTRVLSASAFHWVDPQVGWSKAAAVLRPGGDDRPVPTRQRAR